MRSQSITYANHVQVGSWTIQTIPQAQIASSVRFLRQVHRGEIVEAEKLTDEDVSADGIIVTSNSPAVGIWTADCMPLAVATPQRALILHVSRMSLVHGLLDHVHQYIDAKSITFVYIGPHICEEHFTFEWEGEQIARFRECFPNATRVHDGITHLSLLRAVHQYIDAWQVPANRVHREGRCTFEHVPQYSYRRWLAAGKPGTLQGLATVVMRPSAIA